MLARRNRLFPRSDQTTAGREFDLALGRRIDQHPDQFHEIQDVRKRSKFLVTIGACATAGGIQALRNFTDAEAYRHVVYARPEYVETLATSTPIADHVTVDFELRGCPINKQQLLEVLSAFLTGRRPVVPNYAVCVECKRSGNVCVMVAQGTPCLGPVTQAGCGALCPGFDRGCYGCYGPAAGANVASLASGLSERGVADADIDRLLHTFNAWAPPFRDGGKQRIALTLLGK